MQDISLHILDIVENSLAAGAGRVVVNITEDRAANRFVLEVRDNGRGMDEEILKCVEDPFCTTKSRKFGLGIPLLAQSARECGGDISIQSEPGRGTVIRAEFEYDHIDRKPLGDIANTMIVLIASHPDVDFVLRHDRDGDIYELSTEELRKDLDDVPVNAPAVLKILRDDINRWLNKKDNMIK
jgi:hypothetical protein